MDCGDGGREGGEVGGERDLIVEMFMSTAQLVIYMKWRFVSAGGMFLPRRFLGARRTTSKSYDGERRSEGETDDDSGG